MEGLKYRFGLLGAVMAALLFCNCSTYYYSTLSSADHVGARTPEGDFIQENDTAAVAYNFSGEDAPVTITIYNKLDEPLYVDWGRSAIIIEGKSSSYGDDALAYDEQEGRYTSSQVEIIPPASLVQRQPLSLSGFSFNKISNKEFRSQLYPDSNGEYIKVRVREYTPDDSPLLFRSYLTLFTSGKEPKLPQSLVFDRSFYISQLIKATDLPPQRFVPLIRKSGDTFYVRYVHGQNFGYAMASIAVVAAVVAVGVATETPEDYY